MLKVRGCTEARPESARRPRSWARGAGRGFLRRPEPRSTFSTPRLFLGPGRRDSRTPRSPAPRELSRRDRDNPARLGRTHTGSSGAAARVPATHSGPGPPSTSLVAAPERQQPGLWRPVRTQVRGRAPAAEVGGKEAGEAGGAARRGSVPCRGKAWRRQVGRTSSARARERARAGARGAGVGGGGRMAQLFLNIRAGVRRASRAPSRRAAARARSLGRTGSSGSSEARGGGGAARVASSRGAGRRERRSPRGGRRRRAGLEGAARPRVREPRRPRAPAARRGATRRGDGREPPSPPVRPSLPPWLARSLAPGRNMAAVAASASQDELSKCGAEPAAASGSRLHAGSGSRGTPEARGTRGRASGRAAAAAWVCGGLGRSGGREGERGGPPPRALVGRRFALSRREIETGARGRTTSACPPLRPRGSGGRGVRPPDLLPRGRTVCPPVPSDPPATMSPGSDGLASCGNGAFGKERRCLSPTS